MILEILKYCQNQCSISANENTCPSFKVSYTDECHNHVYKFIPCISGADMKKIMKQVSVCDKSGKTDNENSNIVECSTANLKSLINAFCHPSIITQVKNKLLFNE